MKTAFQFLPGKEILLAFVLSIVFLSCSKTDEKLLVIPTELRQTAALIKKSMDSMNNCLAFTAGSLHALTTDTTLVRKAVLKAYEESSFTDVVTYITPQGIMQIMEPAAYHHYEGANISEQEHIQRMFQTREPALSKLFLTVEGYYGVVNAQPILWDNQVKGAISCLFSPRTFLERIIAPAIKDQDFEIWVVEEGGTILYDQVTADIGKNLYTHPDYADFPGLIALGHKMDASLEGEDSYSYYLPGTSTVVKKHTYWVTYTLNGVSWKIGYVKAE